MDTEFHIYMIHLAACYRMLCNKKRLLELNEN